MVIVLSILDFLIRIWFCYLILLLRSFILLKMVYLKLKKWPLFRKGHFRYFKSSAYREHSLGCGGKPMLYRPFLRMAFIRGPIYLRRRSEPAAFWLRSRERTTGQVFCTKVWGNPIRQKESLSLRSGRCAFGPSYRILRICTAPGPSVS